MGQLILAGTHSFHAMWYYRLVFPVEMDGKWGCKEQCSSFVYWVSRLDVGVNRQMIRILEITYFRSAFPRFGL